MIAYSYITKNLALLERKYSAAPTVTDACFFSKMAILELCGWIEESIDDLVVKAGNRMLKVDSNRTFLERKVKGNYGFEYEKHFRGLLVSLIGYAGCESVEKNVDRIIVLNFKNELKTLKARRNSLAHTYTKGVTHHYDAPSITIARYDKIASGLRAYDEALRLF